MKIQAMEIFKKLVSTFNKCIEKIAVFEFVYKIILHFLIVPLLSGLILKAINYEGLSVLSNTLLADIAKGPLGILAIIVYILISTLLIYFEFAVLCILFFAASKEQTIRISTALKLGLKSIKNLFHISSVGFIIYAMFLIPLLQIGFNSSVITGLRIPDFVSSELAKSNGGAIANDLLFYLPIVIFFLFSFTIPCMVLEQLNFGQALKRNFVIIKRRFIRLFIVLLITVGAISLSKAVFYLIDISGSAFAYSITGMLINVIQFLSTPLLLFAIIAVFLLEATPSLSFQTNEIVIEKASNKKWKTLALALVLVTVVLVDSILPRNSINDLQYTIIGHRGSLEGVENSIEAVESAQKQGADFAEIDILLSKDNVPMVIHDTDLSRLTGKKLAIYELTEKELSKTIIRQESYQSTISSLDEMLLALKPTNLNFLIELKRHGHESASLIESVIQVIDHNQMQERCVFQTSDQDIIDELKKFYPEYKIGYIVLYALGEPDTTMFFQSAADFFSVEESLATPEFIQNCQKAGKEIYVWTINDEERIEHFISLGVDGIITDYPQNVRNTINDSIF